MKKAVGIILLLIAGCAGIYLWWPSNYYLRRALVHLQPQIDQYPIFENRIVKAESPVPWPLSSQYNQGSIPEEFLPGFAEYGTVAFLIIKDGELLFEQYWEDYSPDAHSNSFSMAKSIVALGIGCAIDDGFIRNVDQPVSDFFPEFPGYGTTPLTIRHLLTMSAGVDFEEAYTSPFSPVTRLYYGNDLQKVTFQMKEVEEPGKRFMYQSGVTQLLAYVLEKATGESVSSYVSRKLWTPMEAEEHALWSLDKKGGMEKAYCCFNSNARDFARFGQLILNEGYWKGQQVVSPLYIRQAITPDTTLRYEYTEEPNRYYGYQFWYLSYQGLPVHYLRGILGQYVFAIPEKNAVVVRLGHKRSETRTEQHYPDDIHIWLEAALQLIGKE
ncbi:MAG: beta-lactamase family protein [Tannerellaceae bacterium]|nr:beta-lactamase family protein [Tannerellaceae bacterium]